MKPRDLQNVPRRLHGGLRALLERSGGGLGGFLGRLQDTPGRSWGPRRCVFGGFGVLLKSFWGDFEALEAKTTKCLKMMTLSMKMLGFWYPEDPTMRPKWSLRASLNQFTTSKARYSELQLVMSYF